MMFGAMTVSIKFVRKSFEESVEYLRVKARFFDYRQILRLIIKVN